MARIEWASSNLKLVKDDDFFYHKFTNDDSDDMMVDGSTTSQVFSLEGLETGQRIMVHSITFLIGAAEIFDLDSFGDVTLTNGVLLTLGSNTVTISDNADVHLISSEVHTETAGTGSNTISVLTGHMDFTKKISNAIVIDKDDISITIQDDLSSISYYKASVSGILIDG